MRPTHVSQPQRGWAAVWARVWSWGKRLAERCGSCVACTRANVDLPGNSAQGRIREHAHAQHTRVGTRKVTNADQSRQR